MEQKGQGTRDPSRLRHDGTGGSERDRREANLGPT